MRALLLAALMAALTLAGCVGDDPAPATTEEPTADPFADTEQFQDVKLGPHSGLPRERPDDYEPGLTKAPEWVLGEWWTIELTDRFVGETTTVTRVVAGKEGPDYLVGMPLDDFQDEVMILHHPGFGLVKADTHGYETHDWMFEPLRFPLVVGDSWTSLWESESAQVEHTVLSVDEATGKAELGVRGAQPINITYDAGLGAIERFEAPGYMEYHVLDHGFDYQGMVRVPHSHDLIFINGQIGPAPVPTSATPVQQTVTVPDLYDRTSFSLIIFELAALLGPEPVASASTVAGNGVYQITATAPDGTEFSAQKLPTQGGHVIESFSHDGVAGDWTITTVAGGPAEVFMEGIGYLTFDVSLPDGCVVVTERVHDHGGDCGGHVHEIERARMQRHLAGWIKVATTEGGTGPCSLPGRSTGPTGPCSRRVLGRGIPPLSGIPSSGSIQARRQRLGRPDSGRRTHLVGPPGVSQPRLDGQGGSVDCHCQDRSPV